MDGRHAGTSIGRASWLTAAEKSQGARAAAGTRWRRTGRCAVARSRAWVSSSWRRLSRRASDLEALGVVGDHAGHGRAGVGQPQGDALAGEGVDVAAGVADQQGPAGHPAAGPLPQRTGAHHLGALPGQPLAQHRELAQHLVEGRAAVGEHGDPDEVVGDRGHVGLRARRPVHLHEGGPRRLPDVAAQAEATSDRARSTSRPSRRRTGECRPSAATRWRAGSPSTSTWSPASRTERTGSGSTVDARPAERVGQGGVQGRAAHAAPGPGAEDGLRGRPAPEPST